MVTDTPQGFEKFLVGDQGLEDNDTIPCQGL